MRKSLWLLLVALTITATHSATYTATRVQVNADTNLYVPGTLTIGNSTNTAPGEFTMYTTNGTYTLTLTPDSSQSAVRRLLVGTGAGLWTSSLSGTNETVSRVTDYAGLTTLWRDGTFTGTNTSTAEFVLYTNATAIAASTFSTNKQVRMKFSGTLTNSSGGTVQMTFKCYFGGSVAMSAQVGVTSASTGARSWELNWIVSEYGGSTAQQFHQVHMNPGSGSVAAGNAATELGAWSGYNRTTVDTTAVIPISLTVTMGTSSANADCYYYHSLGTVH